jgi:hypothetical protein
MNNGMPCAGRASNGSSRPSPSWFRSFGDILNFLVISLLGDGGTATAEGALNDDARLILDPLRVRSVWSCMSPAPMSGVIESGLPDLVRSGSTMRSSSSFPSTMDSASPIILGAPRRLTRNFRWYSLVMWARTSLGPPRRFLVPFGTGAAGAENSTNMNRELLLFCPPSLASARACGFVVAVAMSS